MKIFLLAVGFLVSTQAYAQSWTQLRQQLQKAQFAEQLSAENYTGAKEDYNRSLLLAGTSLAVLVGGVANSLGGTAVVDSVTAGGSVPYLVVSIAQAINLTSGFTYKMLSNEPEVAATLLASEIKRFTYVQGQSTQLSAQLANLEKIRKQKVNLDHSQFLDGLTAGFLDYYEMKKIYTFSIVERKLVEEAIQNKSVGLGE